MKLKYIFASLIAGVALLTACEKEADTYLSAVKVDKSIVGFPKEGGSKDIVVTATDKWTVTVAEDDAEWLTVSPASGSAGETKVTITAAAGEDGHDTAITIACGGEKQTVKILQEAGEYQEPPISTIKSVIDAGAGTFRVKGLVTKVANTEYGNFYIKDDTGEIYIYGVKDSKGYPKDDAAGWARFGIDAGDTVTLEGPYSLYGTTHEIVDATVISVEKSLIEVAALDFDILPAIDTTFELSVKSKLSPVLVTSEADWIKVVDLKEADGALVYSITASANPDLADRSADIVVKAKDALKAITVTQKGRPATDADILEKHVDDVLAAEPANGPFYKVTGRIKEIANATYGNFFLEDGTGEIYVYGLTATNIGIGATNDKSFGTLGLDVNDVVTVIGVRGRYENAKDPRQKEQLASAYYVSHKPCEAVTVEAFNAAAVSTDKYYEITGTVTEIKSADYGNIYVEDATGKVYLYGLMNAPLYNLENGKFSNTKCFSTLGVEVGSKVTVRGFRGEYNGIQMTDAFLVSVEAGTAPAAGITIDGNPADWEGIEGVASATCPGEAELKGIKSAKAYYGDKLYILAEFSDDALAKGVTDGKLRFHVFFSGANGLLSHKWKDENIEYMIEGKATSGGSYTSFGGNYYKFKGEKSTDWAWEDSSVASSVTSAGSGNFYEIAIDYADYPGGFPEQVEVGIDCADGSYNVIGFAPQTNHKFVLKKGQVVDLPDNPGDEPGLGEYDSNVTLTKGTSCYDDNKITVNGVENVANLKFGTSKKYGDGTITLPAGTKSLSFYSVAWSGNDASLKLTVGEKEYSVNVAANAGATGNDQPYIIAVTESDKFSITLDSALEAETVAKVETYAGEKTGYRAFIFGVQAAK